MNPPGTEGIRFRRPTHGPNAVAVKKEEPKLDQFGSMAPLGWKKRHMGILQDLVGRHHKGPFVPSFSTALRLLLLVRVTNAMYANIQDCDEVFNFFEPLHYFQHNAGFQTWELSPQFAIRSWAYVLLHWPMAHLGPMVLDMGKRQQFFALRIALAFISSACEAKFYRAVVESVNERVGRYVLFGLTFSAGMWGASIAFLPSSFAMYTTMLASSYALHPATNTATGTSRLYKATFLYALGAIVGWPFSAALAIPFVLEQLFCFGGEVIVGQEAVKQWEVTRFARFAKAVALGALIALPVFLVDSWAYGKSTFPALNIVLYNVFSGSGPELYGTEPATFYLSNLFLNFNFLLPLALVSLPALFVTSKINYRQLGKSQQKPKEGETNPYVLLTLRLLPFYIWLAILTLQPHKEERFFFPAYPLLVLNAAVSVFMIKGWTQVLYIKLTASPYRAGLSPMFSYMSLAMILIPVVLSVSRVIGLNKFYHAPLDVAHHFEYTTIPRILAAAGHSPVPPPKGYKPREGRMPDPVWDYKPLEAMNPRVRVCWGAEWYRFPGSYLYPSGIELDWIKSEFDGMMPRRWEPSSSNNGSWWPRSETRVTRPGRFNGANVEASETGTYVEPSSCAYLVSLHLPSKPPTALEPDYAEKPEWEREFCVPFLDQKSSKWWSRLGWLPAGLGSSGRVFGEYCLLKRK